MPKRWIAKSYNERLSGTDELTLPFEALGAKNVYWMYGILLENNLRGKKDRVMEQLHTNGIETRSFFCPMHLQPVFQANHPNYPQVENGSNLMVSTGLWNRGFYLPSGLGLTMAQIDKVCEKLLKVISRKR